jgi:hypothetical protein
MVNPSDYFCSVDKLLCVHTGRKVAEENSLLWQQELVLKTGEEQLVKDQAAYIERCRTVNVGLYGQRPIGEEKGNKEDYMSPDQLIAIISHFYMIGDKMSVSDIWEWLNSHWLTYDNLSAKTNIARIQQPQAVLFSAICAGQRWLMPFLSIAHIVSCMAKERDTSGKLKAWTMMKTLNMRLTYKICTRLVKDWNIVSGIYFPQENHPLNRIAD